MAEVLGRLFFAGFVRLHVLYHAAQEPICGVEVVAELARHGYRLSPGTVYPVLHELERAGYFPAGHGLVSGKRPSITRPPPRGKPPWRKRKAAAGIRRRGLGRSGTWP